MNLTSHQNYESTFRDISWPLAESSLKNALTELTTRDEDVQLGAWDNRVVVSAPFLATF